MYKKAAQSDLMLPGIGEVKHNLIGSLGFVDSMNDVSISVG